jgi:transcriptional regulator with XRE-family HTH domain
MVIKGEIALNVKRTITRGKVLASVRRSKGKKQEELAYQNGISTQALSSIENDHSAPSFDTFIYMAFALGMKPSMLMTILEENIDLQKMYEDFKIENGIVEIPND